MPQAIFLCSTVEVTISYSYSSHNEYESIDSIHFSLSMYDSLRLEFCHVPLSILLLPCRLILLDLVSLMASIPSMAHLKVSIRDANDH
jgi:hypothetical protein